MSAFTRKFIAEVRRCDEMERKVMYIKKELIKDGMDVPELSENLPAVPNPREFIDLEALFEKTENEILELSENFSQLLQNFQELTELRYVLERTQVSNYQRSIKFPRVTFFAYFLSPFSPIELRLLTWRGRKWRKQARLNNLALLLVLWSARGFWASRECFGVFHVEMSS